MYKTETVFLYEVDRFERKLDEEGIRYKVVGFSTFDAKKGEVKISAKKAMTMRTDTVSVHYKILQAR